MVSAIVRGVTKAFSDQQAPPPSFGGNTTRPGQSAGGYATGPNYSPAGRGGYPNNGRPAQRLQNANPAAPQNAGGRGPLGQTTKSQPSARQIYNTVTKQVSDSKKEKIGTVGGGFMKSGYDKYDTKEKRGQKYVSGYDRRFSGGVVQRRAEGMQFSHVYDGHEPWDDCLPKEKDPWDKDFYSK